MIGKSVVLLHIGVEMKKNKKKTINLLAVSTILSLVIISGCTILSIIGSISELNEPLHTINSIISNPYISGLIYSIGLIFVVFSVQIIISKRKIKHDFRCAEIMEDLFDGIFSLEEIMKNRKDDESDKDFIITNKARLSTIKQILIYDNNNILIESLNLCFFLNLNFELLGIINNIKNRIPNIKKDGRVSDYLNYDKNSNSDFTENDAHIYLTDLQFLAGYWKALLDYLDYDNSYNQILLQYYDKYFPIGHFTTIDDMSVRMRMIRMTFGKEIRKALKEQKKKR